MGKVAELEVTYMFGLPVRGVTAMVTSVCESATKN
jgi:hypothetical protein